MKFALVANAIMSSLDQTKTVGVMVLIFAASLHWFAFSWDLLFGLSVPGMFHRHRGRATGLTTMTNFRASRLMGGVFPIASSASLSGCFGFFCRLYYTRHYCGVLFQVGRPRKRVLRSTEAYRNLKPQLKRKVW
jgi:hypothetical protein